MDQHAHRAGVELLELAPQRQRAVDELALAVVVHETGQLVLDETLNLKYIMMRNTAHEHLNKNKPVLTLLC